MLVDHVIQRLSERIPYLVGRVEGAASLVQLMTQNALPQVGPAARVISSALLGREPQASSGYFVQSFDETVSVFLVFRNVQGSGGNELDLFDSTRMDVINAICGWAPENTVGVFRLANGQVRNMAQGSLIYQIDFAIADQLRITVT
ncbi:MAG: hypothetical protein MUE83_16135 [Tabrizicola sp.]|jgi:hypothetical protein|nr:hypothetical protein [Tabrizicola sp.]